jgi:hypothetical protein
MLPPTEANLRRFLSEREQMRIDHDDVVELASRLWSRCNSGFFHDQSDAGCLDIDGVDGVHLFSGVVEVMSITTEDEFLNIVIGDCRSPWRLWKFVHWAQSQRCHPKHRFLNRTDAGS